LSTQYVGFLYIVKHYIKKRSKKGVFTTPNLLVEKVGKRLQRPLIGAQGKLTTGFLFWN